MTIELYGFSGKLGSGKNFIAEKLFATMLPKKNTIIMALADHLKVDLCAKEKIAYEKIFHKKDEQSRKLLQETATSIREQYGPNVWIDILSTWIKIYTERGIERVIVTDLRYPNEIEWFKAQGGITFRVNAPQRNLDQLVQEKTKGFQEIEKHLSEIGLDNYQKFDYIIQNDYKDSLDVEDRVRDIVNKINK